MKHEDEKKRELMQRLLFFFFREKYSPLYERKV